MLKVIDKNDYEKKESSEVYKCAFCGIDTSNLQIFTWICNCGAFYSQDAWYKIKGDKNDKKNNTGKSSR
jgi:hypothetical protein